MMSNWFFIVCEISVIACGVVSGVFLTFSNFVTSFRIRYCRRLSTASIPIIMVFLSTSVHADEPWARFGINIGRFITDQGTEFRLDANPQDPGTLIDLEKDLDLDEDEDVARVDVFWRYRRRSRLDFSYFELNRSATVNLDRLLEFGEEDFPPGVTVATDFDLEIFKSAYTYAFFRNPTLDLGVTAGIFGMNLRLALAAPLLGKEDKDEAFVPMPVVGLRGTYAITPKLFLRASWEYFKITEDDLEGRLTDTNIMLEHNTFKNVGFGIGFNVVDFNLEDDDGEEKDEFNMEYEGVQLYTKVYF